MNPASAPFLAELRALLGHDQIISEGDSLDTPSKDYTWYPPLPRPVVAPLRAVVAACFRARVALKREVPPPLGLTKSYPVNPFA